MINKTLVSVFFMLVLVITASTFSFFTPHPSGIGVIDDFDEQNPDTNTWEATTPPASGLLYVSHEGGQLKLDGTIGFNQAYTTISQRVSIGQIVSVEMSKDYNDDQGRIGLVLTDHSDSRTFSDQRDGVGVVWQFNDIGPIIFAEARDDEINTLATTFEYGAPSNPELNPPTPFDDNGKTYRFEVWRPNNHSARTRVIDLGVGTGPPMERVLFDELMEWSADPPGLLPDEMLIQLDVLGSLATVNHVKIFPIPTGGVVGDLNGDGRVDILDFGFFAGLFGCSTAPMGSGPAPATCSDADLNTDTVVDILDFSLLAGNFGVPSSGTAAATPEPTMLTLFGLGTLILTCRRRS